MPDRDNRDVPPVDSLSWRPDAPATAFLVERGQIERTASDPDHARNLLAQARQQLASARVVATTGDAATAFVNAYDVARKSLSAMLAVQGLRTRGGEGGHRVLAELLQAQLPRHRTVLLQFDWMRERRNHLQYPDPDTPPAMADEANSGISAAQQILELAEQFVQLLDTQGQGTGRD